MSKGGRYFDQLPAATIHIWQKKFTLYLDSSLIEGLHHKQNGGPGPVQDAKFPKNEVCRKIFMLAGV